jgi:hypothetical protein
VAQIKLRDRLHGSVYIMLGAVSLFFRGEKANSLYGFSIMVAHLRAQNLGAWQALAAAKGVIAA